MQRIAMDNSLKCSVGIVQRVGLGLGRKSFDLLTLNLGHTDCLV